MSKIVTSRFFPEVLRQRFIYTLVVETEKSERRAAFVGGGWVVRAILRNYLRFGIVVIHETTTNIYDP